MNDNERIEHVIVPEEPEAPAVAEIEAHADASVAIIKAETEHDVAVMEAEAAAAVSVIEAAEPALEELRLWHEHAESRLAAVETALTAQAPLLSSIQADLALLTSRLPATEQSERLSEEEEEAASEAALAVVVPEPELADPPAATPTLRRYVIR